MTELASKREIEFNDLNIHQVTKTDLPALEWNGEYHKYHHMYASLYRGTRVGRVLMWVIENSWGEIIGQAFVILYSTERDTADGKERAYVFAFRVKSNWRRQGIGQHLMGFVENDLQDRGFKFVTLNVAKDNLDAIKLYKHLGYRTTGSRPGIWSYKDHHGKIQHVNEPSWRMIKDLLEN